jgi:acetyl-CoA carboxylase biotin carboxyl carrier protein
MTTPDPTWLPQQAHVDPYEAADVLKRLQDSALGLLAGLDRPPSSLRIKVNGVEIEVEWPHQGPAAGGQVAGTPVTACDQPQAGGEGPADHIVASMVGVFYRCPEPGAKPFVGLGDVIVPGQQVGIIEAMKLMIPVETDAAGRIVDVLVADGASVEYGDKLFAVEPTS